MSTFYVKKWYQVLAAVVISGVACALSAAVGTERWADNPEWLWFDDFESTDALSTRYQDVNTNGFEISTDDKYQGARSLRQKYSIGQVNAGWIIRVSDSGFPSHLFMRWYHKFENGFSGLPPKMARMRYRHRSGDWESIFAVHCWIQNSKIVADVSADNSTQANSTGWLPVSVSTFSFADSVNIGRWVCFEMEVQLNTPGKTDGVYRIWADDTLIVESENVDIRGPYDQLFNEVMLDNYWNNGSPKEQSRYFDNFVISTKRIGMIKSAEVKSFQPVILQRLKKNSQPTLQINIGNGSYLYVKRAQECSKVYYLNGAKTGRVVNNQRTGSSGITIIDK